ncbi:hypothetical protein PBOI14_49170 [Pseudomonas sp. Boi14]|nr:hypothetical protein PBOI14_49170 [Pseudomonas sp. Boi14]
MREKPASALLPPILAHKRLEAAWLDSTDRYAARFIDQHPSLEPRKEAEMTLQEFACNIAVGICTTLFLAGIVLFYNKFRNGRIEKSLLKSISDHGMGGNLNAGFSIVFENKSTTPVIVRTICLIEKDAFYIELHPRSNSYNQAALYNQLIFNSKSPRLHIQSQLQPPTDPSSSVYLQPLSGAIWECGLEPIKRSQSVISECVVLIEYPALFGGSVLLKAVLSPEAVKRANEIISDIRAGEFNLD